MTVSRRCCVISNDTLNLGRRVACEHRDDTGRRDVATGVAILMRRASALCSLEKLTASHNRSKGQFTMLAYTNPRQNVSYSAICSQTVCAASSPRTPALAGLPVHHSGSSPLHNHRRLHNAITESDYSEDCSGLMEVVVLLSTPLDRAILPRIYQVKGWTSRAFIAKRLRAPSPSLPGAVRRTCWQGDGDRRGRGLRLQCMAWCESGWQSGAEN
jgi:hypothetical protein